MPLSLILVEIYSLSMFPRFFFRSFISFPFFLFLCLLKENLLCLSNRTKQCRRNIFVTTFYTKGDKRYYFRRRNSLLRNRVCPQRFFFCFQTHLTARKKGTGGFSLRFTDGINRTCDINRGNFFGRENRCYKQEKMLFER